MEKRPLIAVAVITNCNSIHFATIYQFWKQDGFVIGSTLFFCGPRQCLLEKGIDDLGIIDYIDPPYYGKNFHINHKKRIACDAIDAEYIFIVHDRFVPKKGLFKMLNNFLLKCDFDFGAVNVDNIDGSPSLRELRLRNSAATLDLNSALELFGRLTCTPEDSDASNHLAINGGQFFIRKSLATYLSRPMRWVEMEDDILSHDLRLAKGGWIKETGLVTLVPRVAPNSKNSFFTRFKYAAYIYFCNTISAVTPTISVGQRIDQGQLERLIESQFYLIDPLHKIFSSDFLPSSLEKLMTRARVLSNGRCWVNVKKQKFGWVLVGIKN